MARISIESIYYIPKKHGVVLVFHGFKSLGVVTSGHGFGAMVGVSLDPGGPLDLGDSIAAWSGSFYFFLGPSRWLKF